MSADAPLQLLDELRSRGVTLAAVGDSLRVTARRGAAGPELRNRILEHKVALLEILRRESSPPAPPEAVSAKSAFTLRCFACRERRFWKSIYGVVVCGNCHPPAADNLVEAWFLATGQPW